jgi:hypothetical protein
VGNGIDLAETGFFILPMPEVFHRFIINPFVEPFPALVGDDFDLDRLCFCGLFAAVGSFLHGGAG